MNEQEKELFDIFKEMSPETQNIYLSHGRFAVATEQSMRKQYGIQDPLPVARPGKTA
jgi:hypothetical protein